MTHGANDVQNNSQVRWKGLGNLGSVRWSQAVFGKIPRGRRWAEENIPRFAQRGVKGMEKGWNVPKGRSEPGRTAATMPLRCGGHPHEAVGFLLSLPMSGRAVRGKTWPLPAELGIGTSGNHRVFEG